jgi:hypothetical protein
VSEQPVTLAEGFDAFLAALERHGGGPAVASRPYVAGAFYAGAGVALPLLIAAFSTTDPHDGEVRLAQLLHELHQFKDGQRRRGTG